MIKKNAVYGVAVLASLLVVSDASAAQFGVALGGSSGKGKSADTYMVPDFDEQTGEIDFVLNVGKSSPLINYRLDVGVGAGQVKYDCCDSGKDDLVGITITNTVGLKIVDIPELRFWLGGSLYLAGYDLNGDYSEDAGAFVWGGGPTLAFDFGDSPTFSVEVGGRFLRANVDGDDGSLNHKIKDVIVRLSVLWGHH